MSAMPACDHRWISKDTVAWACLVCGQSGNGPGAAAHEPPAEPTYEQRREQVARRRNPDAGGWTWISGVEFTIPCANEGSEGVARAVANLDKRDWQIGWRP